jgi:hypothetical protein
MLSPIVCRVVAILLLLLAVVRAPSWAAEELAAGQAPATFNATAADPALNEAVERLLDNRVSFESGEQSFGDLVGMLAHHKIDAVLDARALEEVGFDSDTPLRPLKVADITLRSVLHLLLDAADLTYVVRDGKLMVTTTEVADMELVSKIYRVDDLARRPTAKGDQYDYDSLVELIEGTIAPQSWDEVGGPGSTCAFQGTLVISQTEHVHARIAQVLAALRASRDKQVAGTGPEPIWAERAAEHAARRLIADKSKAAQDFQFVEVPLEKVTQDIASRYGVQIVLELGALEEAGVGTDTPVTANLRQVTLPVALALVLEPLDLTYVIRDEVMLVTTAEVASQELPTVVYPAADLLQYGQPQVGTGQQDFDTLIEVITTSVLPNSWDEVGGPATISESAATSSLCISQTRVAHDEILRLLAGLRQLRTPLAEPPRAAARAAAPVPMDAAGYNDDIVTRMYNLSPKADVGQLFTTLRAIEPESWKDSGSQIAISPRRLTVRNTRSVHRKIATELIHSGAGAPRTADGTGGGSGGGFF